MLKEVAGDILLTKAEALAHGVAPNDNFANGLALALRERWPAMYKDFRHYSQTFTPKTGELWTWSGVGAVRIVNLFTQEAAASHGAKPGRATIENVNHCLKALCKEIEAEKFKSVALPRLATGVGRPSESEFTGVRGVAFSVYKLTNGGLRNAPGVPMKGGTKLIP